MQRGASFQGNASVIWRATHSAVGFVVTLSLRLAQSLGINGTPGYVIGDGVVPGAIGAPGLKERIQEARGRRGG
jgi:hypothetical protein